ncbi:MAG: LacI family transcriptional regulator [Planctomycetes bacterium]|nr:LacI family transcriptional regulator [Planctomycetota bacterium]
MIRLKDIAEAADVSIPLVSKVLNNRLGSTGARPETIRRIQAAADRLGYRRNEAAAALREGRQNVIGVLVRWLGAAGSGLIDSSLAGLAAGCHRYGLRQQLSFFADDAEFRALAEGALPSTMDGLIAVGSIEPSHVDALLAVRSRGVPVVTVHGAPLAEEIPNAGCDDGRVSGLATEHLIAQGCTRIAHFDTMPRRTAGYRQALEAAALAWDGALVEKAELFDHHAGAAAATALLDRGLSFDGLVAQSDEQAMGAIRRLQAAGLRIGHDVKIVGVDNSPYCEFLSVSLSSVSGEDYARARRAVDMMTALQQGRRVESVLIEPVLHVRESSDPTGRSEG